VELHENTKLKTCGGDVEKKNQGRREGRGFFGEGKQRDRDGGGAEERGTGEE